VEQFHTGEWVMVSVSGSESTCFVLCQIQNELVLSNGLVCPTEKATRMSMKRLFRFILSEDTVHYLRSRWAETFDGAEPGMRLLVLVPPFGPDPKNYALAKLVVLAVKDSNRKVLYDQDGDFIDINQAFYFGEKIVSANGFLTEKGQKVLGQLYSE